MNWRLIVNWLVRPRSSEEDSSIKENEPRVTAKDVMLNLGRMLPCKKVHGKLLFMTIIHVAS
jgi:hypothetical protein